MREQKSLTLSKYSQFSAMILSSAVFLANGQDAQAETLDAGYVLNKMTAEQRGSYLSGVVEGLAFARFVQDRPDESGMACIYNWQNENLGRPEAFKTVAAWLERHSERTVGVLLYTLIKRECGE